MLSGVDKALSDILKKVAHTWNKSRGYLVFLSSVNEYSFPNLQKTADINPISEWLS